MIGIVPASSPQLIGSDMAVLGASFAFLTKKGVIWAEMGGFSDICSIWWNSAVVVAFPGVETSSVTTLAL